MKTCIALTVLILFSTINQGLSQKINSADFNELKTQIADLKLENQKLVLEISSLKQGILTLESNLKASINQQNQNSDKIQKSILFLGQDINDVLKGYSKNLPEKYNKKAEINSENNGETKTVESTKYSGQCNAITKKGSRCSRSAKSNGYCYQHGG
jgi:hypothetical protein